MQLIDSHCHLDRLDLTAFDGKLDLAIQAAQDAGVSHLLCVCIDLENFPAVLAIAERYPFINASVGVHPTEQQTGSFDADALLADLLKHAQHPNVIAIGETGLDYMRISEPELIKQQQAQFVVHIEAAKTTKKPLIIHTRHAREDTIELLKTHNAEEIGGVFHCFTEDWDMAKKALDLGFYISLSGIVTFKNAEAIQSLAKRIPLDRLLIETDAPYLAPMPYRGKPNQPAYVRYVAEKIAELRGVSVGEIAESTGGNFFRCFKLN